MDSSNRRKNVTDSRKIGNSRYPDVISPSAVNTYSETGKKPHTFEQQAAGTSRNGNEDTLSNVWISLSRKSQVCSG